MILTVDQVAERLQLPPAHVREMIREGLLPGFKRSKRLWGVSEEGLSEYIKIKSGKSKEANSDNDELVRKLKLWLAMIESAEQEYEWCPSEGCYQNCPICQMRKVVEKCRP